MAIKINKKERKLKRNRELFNRKVNSDRVRVMTIDELNMISHNNNLMSIINSTTCLCSQAVSDISIMNNHKQDKFGIGVVL